MVVTLLEVMTKVKPPPKLSAESSTHDPQGREMRDKCEVCRSEGSSTVLTLFGQTGAIRISVGGTCQAKARSHDSETWDKIRAIVRDR